MLKTLLLSIVLFIGATPLAAHGHGKGKGDGHGCKGDCNQESCQNHQAKKPKPADAKK